MLVFMNNILCFTYLGTIRSEYDKVNTPELISNENGTILPTTRDPVMR